MPLSLNIVLLLLFGIIDRKLAPKSRLIRKFVICIHFCAIHLTLLVLLLSALSFGTSYMLTLNERQLPDADYATPSAAKAKTYSQDHGPKFFSLPQPQQVQQPDKALSCMKNSLS